MKFLIKIFALKKLKLRLSKVVSRVVAQSAFLISSLIISTDLLAQFILSIISVLHPFLPLRATLP